MNRPEDIPSTTTHSHHPHTHANPNECNCPEERGASDHRNILNHITEIEKLFKELTVAQGVVAELNVQTNAAKDVDPSVPPDGRRGHLDFLSHALMELKLGDET